MKKLTIILTLTLISVYAVSQTSISSVLSMNHEIEYETKRPKKIVESTIFYNSNGKRIEQIDKRTKTSDDTGILFVEERSDEMGTRLRLTYVNDTINRLQVARVLEKWYHWGGYSKETAIYDYDRNKVILRVFSNKGTVLSKNIRTIDFSKVYFGKKHRNFYNEQGNIIKSVNVRGKKGYLHEYIYDIYGNCTEHQIYKVTFKKNGKEKKTICRIYRKEYTY